MDLGTDRDSLSLIMNEQSPVYLARLIQTAGRVNSIFGLYEDKIIPLSVKKGGKKIVTP